MKKLLSLSMLCFVLLFSTNLLAQKLSGTVTADGAVQASVSVTAKPTNKGTTTNNEGKYTLALAAGTYKITFSNTGFTPVVETVTVAAGEDKTLDVVLTAITEKLDEVLIVGTRSLPRSSGNSPLPVDNFDAKSLKSTGQLTFDKALQYRVPSFNTVQTPVNDATSLLDPYEIRNMGPSRTLILINGKRKNMSSLVYTQTSPGRGETGADISAIPTDAIERVEILRDGASAQYGSDAIAGVMNIILKKNSTAGSANFRTGITTGDNVRFIKLWFEISSKEIQADCYPYSCPVNKWVFSKITSTFTKHPLINRT